MISSTVTTPLKCYLFQDYPNTSELLSPDNIDYTRAQTFARVRAITTNSAKTTLLLSVWTVLMWTLLVGIDIYAV